MDRSLCIRCKVNPCAQGYHFCAECRIPLAIRKVAGKCCSVCGSTGHDARRHTVEKVRPCSICGSTDHDRRRHTHTDVTEKLCRVCLKVCPIGRFGTVIYHRKDGTTRTYFSYRCVSCQVVYSRDHARTNVATWLGTLIAKARHVSKMNGVSCTVDRSFLVQLYEKQKGLCYYTGKPLSLEKGDSCISIDRKDPLLGYTPDNVVLTSWLINRIKNDMPYESFVSMCYSVSLIHKA